MFEIVQAPAETTSKGIKLFIAGGIRNCPNWQNELIKRLFEDERIKEEIYEEDDIRIIIFNPRCNEVPEENSQIKWEYDKLKKSDIISFWFSEGSQNHITLFEYGSWFKSNKQIIVGCHPNYEKRNNVKVQTELVNPRFKINEDFESFYEDLVDTLIGRIIQQKNSHINGLFKS